MDFSLESKVAIITGAASGIGNGIAEFFAERGAKIVIADLNGESGERASEKLIEKGGECLFVNVDVGKSEDVRRLMGETVNKFGGIDILINNAGLQHVQPVDEFDEDKWDLLHTVMMRGTFLCTKYALPVMRSSPERWGRVINISSIHGQVASKFKSAYVSAKHAIVGFTKTVALEVGEDNITINSICPSYLRTLIVEKQIKTLSATHGISEEEVIENIMLVPMPQKEFVTVEEIAAIAAFLSTDYARHINGASIPVDGGWTAQ